MILAAHGNCAGPNAVPSSGAMGSKDPPIPATPDITDLFVNPVNTT